MTEEERLYRLIGQNVKYYRQLYNLNKRRENRLTQERLAELAGVSVSLIGNLESESLAQGISVYNLWKISGILEAPIQSFFEAVNLE